MKMSAACWIALLLVGAGAAAAEEDGRLRFNPFAVPDLVGLPGGEGPRAAAPVDEAWQPVLRATLVAADTSLADLGGVLLAVGEEIHGYRLLEVRPFEAVFERGGERMVLAVPPAAAVQP